MADLVKLGKSVIEGDQESALAITQEALSEKTPAEEILAALISAMDLIGERFSKNEIYIPEMLIAARAMKSAMEVLEPELVKAGVEPKGNFVVGTVAGDLHDIGKNLVATMMKGAGYEVIDMGVDVSTEKFVEQAKASNALVVGLSTLLTTTMPAMAETVKAIRDAGLTSKIIVGGAPVTQDYADKIGADGYAENAADTVSMIKELVA